MDWVIQKATELGASEICVLRAHRSIPRVEGAPSRTRMERWNRIAVEAARQCGRTRVPILSGPVTLETLCRRVAREAGLKLVAWEGETKRGLRGAVAEAGQGCQEAWLAVGPEGGFEEVEVRALEGAGFRPVRLGPRILRTESAGPAAMAILQHLLGDLE
jgi:16S rRNA (uracil1498-N3)-methyltransferase